MQRVKADPVETVDLAEVVMELVNQIEFVRKKIHMMD